MTEGTDLTHILVAIPVFNHAATLRDVVERCLQQYDQVLVVDDGSHAPVAPLIADLPVTVLRHDLNRGKGQAILTAADYGKQQGMTHLIILDADGQHFPEDLPRFFAAVAQEPLAIHVGLRDFSAEDVPGSSRFGRQFSNFWLKVQTGHKLGMCRAATALIRWRCLIICGSAMVATRLRSKCWLRPVGPACRYGTCRFKCITRRAKHGCRTLTS